MHRISEAPDKTRYELNAIVDTGSYDAVGKRIQIPVSILEIPQLPPVAMNLGDQIVLHPIDKIEFEYILQKQISFKEYNG